MCTSENKMHCLSLCPHNKYEYMTLIDWPISTLRHACVCVCANLDTLPIELQRPLSEIDPDRCLWVFQEGPSAESVGQTRLSHIRISDDDDLKNPRLWRLIVVLRRELQGLILPENDVKFLPGLVFYCHRSCSRRLDTNASESIARMRKADRRRVFRFAFGTSFIYRHVFI